MKKYVLSWMTIAFSVLCTGACTKQGPTGPAGATGPGGLPVRRGLREMRTSRPMTYRFDIIAAN